MNKPTTNNLVSGGVTKDLGLAPLICETGLMKNFDDTTKTAFLEAATYVGKQNPVLTGYVGLRKEGAYVQTGKFDNFCTQIDRPHDLPSPEGLSAPQDLMQYMNRVDALFPRTRMGAIQVQKRLPVFHVYLVELGDGFAAYCIRLSHYVGDATTLRLLEDQLLARMVQGETGVVPPEIEWDEEAMSEVNVFLEYKKFPQRATLRDRLAFPVAAAPPNVWSLMFPYRRRCHQMLLSCAKIDRKKRELVRHNNDNDDCGNDDKKHRYLSTYDVIVAALAQSKDLDSHVLYSCMSQRGRRRRCRQPQLREGNDGETNIGENMGGNLLLSRILFQQECTDPNKVHRQHETTHDQHFRPGSIPWWSLLRGSASSISSWRNLTASSKKKAMPDFVVCKNLPRSAFLSSPLDMIVISQFDHQHIAVTYCKRKAIDTTKGLLGELVA